MDVINNQMIDIKTLKTFFDEKKVYIPLLQRNYKWSEEEAAKLAEDLWDNYTKNCEQAVGDIEEKSGYTVGMVTLYEEEGNIQLIDGQQRIITLTLLLKSLDPEGDYFKFEFERDIEQEEKKKRSYFINECLKCEIFDCCKKQYLYTDTIRFKNNYNAIRLPITIRDLEICIKIINQLEVDIKYIKDENDKEKVGQAVNEFNIKIGYDENLLKEEINKLGLKTYTSFFINECKKKIFTFKLAERISELIINNGFIKVESNKIKIEEIIMKYGIPTGEFNKYINNLKNDIFKEFIYLVRFEEKLEENSRRKRFIDYILNNVFVLFHVTDSKPIDEFLNINKNKTKFVISDYIKANLIIDTKKNEEKRNEIVKLFQDLSAYFYSNDNKDIWELVRRGYKCDKDENRLKLLFCDRYDENSKKGYQYEKEYKRLLYYKEILKFIKEEITLALNIQNWNSYNAFCCLHECKKIKFFEMFGKEYDENVQKMRLEEVIWSQFNLEEIVYHQLKSIRDKNYFLESQLYIEKNEFIIDYNLPEESKDKWVYLLNEERMSDLNNTIMQYISYKKKGMNATIAV